MKHLKYFKQLNEGLAFEISTDDVISAVGDQMQISLTEEEADRIYQELDHDKIESAALYGNNEDDQLDEQTQLAYDEIVRQVREMDLSQFGITQRLNKERFDL